MRVSEAFPSNSNFLKASDLQGRQLAVTMSTVQREKIGNEPDLKHVLYFQGKEKGLVLNITNANMIADLYGEEMDSWPGGEIILYEAMVQFQGKMVPAIRVRAVPRKAPVAQKPTTAEIIGGDDIPF